MPVSGKFQRAIDNTARQEKRRKVIGYVMTGVAILALIVIAWYIMTTKDSRRFRGIEKFRGSIATEQVLLA